MSDATQEKYWIGFDLGGTKMFSAVYGEKFVMLGKHRTKTKGHEGSKAGLRRIISTMDNTLATSKMRIFKSYRTPNMLGAHDAHRMSHMLNVRDVLDVRYELLLSVLRLNRR